MQMNRYLPFALCSEADPGSTGPALDKMRHSSGRRQHFRVLLEGRTLVAVRVPKETHGACVSASPANEQPNEKRNERERMERGTQDKRSKDVHTGPPKGSLRAIFTWAAHFFSGDYLRTAPLPLTPSYIYTHRWHYQEENRAKCRPHPQVCGWQQNRIEQSAISFFFTGGSRDNLEQKNKRTINLFIAD